MAVDSGVFKRPYCDRYPARADSRHERALLCRGGEEPAFFKLQSPWKYEGFKCVSVYMCHPITVCVLRRPG